MNGVWYAAVGAVFILGLLFLRVYATKSRTPRSAAPASDDQAEPGWAVAAETEALRRAAEAEAEATRRAARADAQSATADAEALRTRAQSEAARILAEARRA